jgi:monoamine oxidase
MGRSLYAMLRRRHGRRPTGEERARHARYFQERLRSVLPIDVIAAKPAAGAPAPSIAVIGAGFAGCAAAHVLGTAQGCSVTVYDADGTAGGRVWSSPTVVPGRILEVGAELIGLNHPAWITFATHFGMALGVVTPDDDYDGVGLESPLYLKGVPQDSKKLYDAMTPIFTRWVKASKGVPWFAPWKAPNAKALDRQNLAAHIPTDAPADLAYAIELEFEMNNTVAASSQSWLGNLAQFQAGQAGMGSDATGFFDYTEIFRSTAGNQALATALLGSTPVVRETVTGIDTANGVKLSFQGGGTSPVFDYVVVATSVDVWSRIQVDGGAFPYAPVQFGPAIKYLAPVEQRFWVPQKLAPSSMADTFGMTWEGTDNQAATAAYDLTVFSGGRLARAAMDAGGTDAYFAPMLSAVYLGFQTPGGTFAHGDRNVLSGYSCPAPGQVTGAQQSYGTLYNDRLAVAGEHTSAGWFGFMEGALESGVAAAVRLARAASMPIKPEWGGTEGV